jgi:hypothetical protein
MPRPRHAFDARRSTLEAALPIRDWQRLAQVEPSLAALETLCAGRWSPAGEEILYSLVGWYRGLDAPNYLVPDKWTSLCLDDAVTPVRAGVVRSGEVVLNRRPMTT